MLFYFKVLIFNCYLFFCRCPAVKDDFPLASQISHHNAISKHANTVSCSQQREPEVLDNKTSSTETKQEVETVAASSIDIDESLVSRTVNLSLGCNQTQRPIYPNVPFSPYSSPRSVRRRKPLKESRRVSIDKSGSFLQLNQYSLMDSIGQVSQH